MIFPQRLLRRAVTGVMCASVVLTALLPSFAYAASTYTTSVASATVGVETSATFSYVLDTTQQTWAQSDGFFDILTIALPANFPAWASLTYAVEVDSDNIDNGGTGVGEGSLSPGLTHGTYAVSGRNMTIFWSGMPPFMIPIDGMTVRVVITAGLTPTAADAASAVTFGGMTSDGADTDPSGSALINVAAAVTDAAASLALGTNSVVGAAGNATLTVDIPEDLNANATFVFVAPTNLNVSMTASSTSHTFAGTAIILCRAVSATQTVTCTVSGGVTDVLTAGVGTIVIGGITASYEAPAQSITNIAVTNSSAAVVAEDAIGSVTDTAAADAVASLALAGNSVVGVTGNSTLTITLPTALLTGGDIIFILPDNLGVPVGMVFVSQSFGGAGTFACLGAAQVVTCTSDVATIPAGTGTIVLSGVESLSVASGQLLSAVIVQQGSNLKAVGATGNGVTNTTLTAVSTTVTSISFGSSPLPTNLKLIINHGEASTNKLTVDVEASATGATEVALSTRADFNNAVWRPLSPVMQVNLANNSGVQQIYAKFINTSGGVSSVVSGSITYTPSASTVVTPPVTTTPPVVPTTPVVPIVEADAIKRLATGAYDPSVARQASPSIAVDLKLVTNTVNAKCTADSLVKIAGNSAVYYCGADGKRYVFPNSNIFKTWYSDYSTVKTISADELASLQIGGSVKYRPGVTMLKLQTDPRVYFVAPGGLLRWVSSEAIALKLFGATWNKQVQDVSDAFISNYSMGASLTE